jgi:type IX secretion system PorP/SprF family membrane protein
MSMKKRLFGALFFMVTGALFAQDIHFSQTAQTPLLINPACAGVYDGWERVTINHRNQWLGAGTQFMTSSVAADINLGKDSYRDKAHVGIGALFYNDIGGDSKFGSQAGSLTVSGILPVGGGHTISAGIQGGFASRKADYTALTFSSQWNGNEYDQSLLSGESNGLSGYRYIDASAGLLYVYDASKNSFQRKDNFKVQFGIGGYHLNRPMMQFNSVDGGRLYRKFVIHTSINSDIAMSDWSIDASAVQFIQGPHFETIFGTLLKYRLKDGTKITGYNQDAYFGFGMFYRLKDALCPTVLIDWRGFKLGVSYDATVSSMRKAYTGGSIEFSLSYTNLSHALFKTRNHSRF